CGREQRPHRDLSHHLVAGHEIPDLHTRPQVQGQEPQGAAAGVSRRRSPWLERVRGRCEPEEPLGRHHQRRQIVQTTELGGSERRGLEMTNWPNSGLTLGVHPSSSFPNSVWERASTKLRFETEFRECSFPNRSLGTRGKTTWRSFGLTLCLL